MATPLPRWEFEWHFGYTRVGHRDQERFDAGIATACFLQALSCEGPIARLERAYGLPAIIMIIHDWIICAPQKCLIARATPVKLVKYPIQLVSSKLYAERDPGRPCAGLWVTG